MKKVSKIILINSKKEVLLHRRDNKRGIPFRGYWDLIGGGLEEGESYLEAIKREIKEEINCKVKNIEQLKTEYIPERKQELTHFVGYVNVSLEKITCHEGTGLVSFFKIDGLPKKFPRFHRKFFMENRERILYG